MLEESDHALVRDFSATVQRYGFIIDPGPGDIAQLVECTDRTREARGSNPLISKFLRTFEYGAGSLLEPASAAGELFDVFAKTANRNKCQICEEGAQEQSPRIARNDTIATLRAISSGG